MRDFGPDAEPHDAVYRWSHAWGEPGKVETFDYAAARRIDFDALRDDQGRSYAVIGDVSSEGVEVSIVPYAPRRKEGVRPKVEAPAVAVESGPRVDDAIWKWLDTAKANDRLRVDVRLVDQPPLQLPKARMVDMKDDPILRLRLEEDRIFGMEVRKTEIEALQKDLRAQIEAQGEYLGAYWIDNGFEATVDVESLYALLGDARVERIDAWSPPVAASIDYDGGDVHEYSQVGHMLDGDYDGDLEGGFDGETASGRSSASDMFIAVLDEGFDMDHVAWLDGPPGSASRIVSGSIWTPFLGWQNWHQTANGHGNEVLGSLGADMTDGQNPITPFAPGFSGATLESSFALVRLQPMGYTGCKRAIERAIDLNVDLVNISMQCGGYCDVDDPSNDAVDAAMLDGVFVGVAVGNEGLPGCSATPPSTASGAFAVGANEMYTDQDYDSSSGGDQHGRAIVDLMAPSFRDCLPIEGDLFDCGTTLQGTSYATPIAVGAAANLKDELVGELGSFIGNEVGWLHALMGGMGLSGRWMQPWDGFDELRGGGSLRMRMLNNRGMDGAEDMASRKWRVRFFSATLYEGQEAVFLANPNASGVNENVSIDVDIFRTSVWWHEPNIEDPVGSTALMGMEVCRRRATTTCWLPSDGRGQQKLMTLNGDESATRDPGNARLDVTIDAIDVPVSNDSDWFPGLAARKVFAVTMYEDLGRDDADGPPAGIISSSRPHYSEP